MRFTVYAVPVAALGVAFLIVLVASLIRQRSASALAQYGFIAVATIAILYPNVRHVNTYMVPTVLEKSEVAVLDRLNELSDSKDYAISWWDYGFPIRYYGGVKTLADGAQHQGEVNFPISFAMIQPQTAAATMARLNVEYKEATWGKPYAFLPDMMKKYGFKDPNLFLEYIGIGDLELPQKTRDVYFYLPMRMLDILPTVVLFSNLDLSTGESRQNPFLYKTNTIIDLGATMNLGNGFVLDKNSRAILINGQSVPINTYTVTGHNQEGKTLHNSQVLNPNAPIHVIKLESFNTLLIIDDLIFNSTYVQLFFLDRYDPALFEKVIETPLAKVFKLKI